MHAKCFKYQSEKENEAERDFAEIQDQTFTCINSNASDTSATPF